MKRRNFITLSALGGLGLSLATHHLLAQDPVDGCTAKVRKSIQEPLLRFVAVADTGMGDKGQYAVANAMTCYHQSHPFDLVLLGGDNIYYNGEIEKINSVFEEPYQALLQQNVKFQAVLGNHDIRTNNGEDELRYAAFNMTGRYYTFSRDRVQFFALDTNDNAPWDEQLKWLEENLAASKATWKIVYGHHPLYSSGVHGGSDELIKLLSPLFSRYGVQVYICGHDHHYERTNPIKGTTYLICGGGAGTRIVGSSAYTAYSASILSFASFEVYPNRLEIRGIDNKGDLFDEKTIMVAAESRSERLGG
ncbi:metallophosphoesterase [Merismopedia glauca]|uniref:Metallophosphoesterase n=1 Tax=Merismopedia glauca CCAP 1448/3 TaxID=1296344 RepID=A0A2T1C7Z2_9CYAN|nr:metallophosphoesterase [Merismopedia glauca]PSB04288.1 metallophosphoesterase [Merismopedia glauca CCAP 1448/3]